MNRSGTTVRIAGLLMAISHSTAAAQSPTQVNAKSGASVQLLRGSCEKRGCEALVAISTPAPAGTYAVRDAWWYPLASAVAPGLGQLLLRQDRAVAYVAMEAFVVAQYFRDREDARRQRDSYKALARRVARALFAAGGLPDGDFDYYERMEKFVESGAFDVVPGGPLEPEDDETTFNGSVWRLARETYWLDPTVPPSPQSQEYRRALAFYAERAVKPEFRWSWLNAQLEHDLFIRTIDASNRAFRRSIADLGALLANHALSTVDAYITVRLRWRASEPVDGPRTGLLEVTVPWAPFGRPGTPHIARERASSITQDF
jgi:hypothetical protein